MDPIRLSIPVSSRNMWAVLLLLLLSYFKGGVGIISFPVQLTNSQIRTFTLQDEESPQTAIRKFCYEVFDSHEGNCKLLMGFLANLLSERDGANVPWVSCEDDVLQSVDVTAWGHKLIQVNLHPLSGTRQCTSLVIPIFTTYVSPEVSRFCAAHSLSGMACRALTFEVHNLATNTYFREGGATMHNMLQGMYSQQELEIMYYPLSLENSTTGQMGRYFFFTDIQFAIPSVCKFCLQHSLPRQRCKMIVDYTDKKMQAYYGSGYAGQLWALQYVLNSLQAIADDKPTTATGSHQQPGSPITADFVEIGTSNFDTIIQLVDDADAFVGFSVEPSRHYLSALPHKVGVTKVNCAIIKNDAIDALNTVTPSAAVTAPAPQFVDLYYVPEEVINNLNLYYYLKGCNSIGGYHPAHVQFNVQQHVVIDKVPAMSITAFLSTYNIKRIRLLKIDAEGYDLTIMQELYLHIMRNAAPIVRVERIIFESNDEEQRGVVNELIRNYMRLGYSVVMTGENTVLELK